MYIDPSAQSPSQTYFQLTQTVIPRPVAWILSENEDGSHNLAPFSYFNAVCSDPPLLMVSIGKKPDGAPKDTRVNIEQRRKFVIHIAHVDMAQAVTDSSAGFAAGESEVEQLGLNTVPFEGFDLPRLADCRIAYACECYQIQEVGNTQQAMILGEVKAIYLDDDVVGEDAKGRMKVLAEKVNPLGRLGGDEYVTFGEILSIPRPK